MRNHTPRVLALLTCAVLGVACSSDSEPMGSTTPTSDKGTVVDVQNIAFKPAEIEVDAGTNVRWVNRDEAVAHTVTSGVPGRDAIPGVRKAQPPKTDGLFDAEVPDAGEEFSFTFEDAGTYKYFCAIHPSMVATVVVRA